MSNVCLTCLQQQHFLTQPPRFLRPKICVLEIFLPPKFKFVRASQEKRILPPTFKFFCARMSGVLSCSGFGDLQLQKKKDSMYEQDLPCYHLLAQGVYFRQQVLVRALYTSMCACVFVCVCVCLCMYVCMTYILNIYIYIHIYIHIYT